VYARAADGSLLTVHVAGQRAFRAGDGLVASLPIEHLHLFQATDDAPAIDRASNVRARDH
jgi:hypothetical protein